MEEKKRPAGSVSVSDADSTLNKPVNSTLIKEREREEREREEREERE